MHQPEQTETGEHSHEYVHIGAKFRELRLHYGLSVPQVAQQIHIRPKYIEALEENDMKSLPGRVYTMGYLQSYAEFLGLDPQQALSEYRGLKQERRRDYTIVEPTQQSGMPSWRLLLVGLAMIGLAYGGYLWLFNQPPGPALLQSRIEPVPDYIERQVQQALVLTDENYACLNLMAPDGFMPCYYDSYARFTDTTPASFLLSPTRSLMERLP